MNLEPYLRSVKRVAKAILIGLAALVLLAVIAVFAINIYVQSASSQARIERALSRALEMPVKIARLSFTPWEGLSATTVTVPQTQPGAGGHFLEAASIELHLQLLPLFSRKLHIDEVRINDPKVTWFQIDGGRWRLPQSGKVETPAEPARPKKETASEPFEVTVKQMNILRGSFVFNDQQGRLVASFVNVNVNCPVATAQRVEGTATVESVSLRDQVFLTDVQAPFTYTPEALVLPDFRAALAGGRITGAFTMRAAEKGSPFQANAQAEAVEVNRLISEAGGPENQATGSLSARLELSGQLSDRKSISGKGRMSVTGGRIRQYELFETLSQALRIEELAKLELSQAEAEFRLGDERVRVESLRLQSPNLKLAATGLIGFNAKLDLDARLSVNQKISAQLPQFIEDNFAPIEGTNERAIEFDIKGTLDEPKTNLLERMMGQKLQRQLTDVFQQIFGGSPKKEEKKEKKKKKSKPEESQQKP